MIKENTVIKKDTLENWNKAKNFIPKENEVIIYTDVGIKIGNGITKIGELPFTNSILYSVEDTTLVIQDMKGEIDIG
jgi:hypothetical protein